MLALVVPAALVALAGCGEERPVEAGNPSTPRPETRLVVRVQPAPGDQPKEWTLTCRPAGGTHPAPEAACEALHNAADPFKPVPPDAICTQIYGGPQTATIEGVWRGEQIRATYSRENGCEIHRWETIKAVLQPHDVPSSTPPDEQ